MCSFAGIIHTPGCAHDVICPCCVGGGGGDRSSNKPERKILDRNWIGIALNFVNTIILKLYETGTARM